ncbi:MAG TPA: nucleotidyltransferase domain-containing protein [Bacteroidales bacterium]|nr:nucleotidyltransferase domain-containing protein [Bacteroidales bacterium]
MITHRQFIDKAVGILKTDENVIGLAIGGSWLTGDIDEYSDLDLVLVARDKIYEDKGRMLGYARKLGKLLAGFTGEHVGEPRLLVCLYDEPLLHIDIKFVTLEEFSKRVEDPVVLFERENQLSSCISGTGSEYPYPDFQWIEDRFWIWVHYILAKIGRGEYLEAFDSFSFLRGIVLGPLIHIKNGNLPRTVRKAESAIGKEDLRKLLLTVPTYEKSGLMNSLGESVNLYRALRSELFDSTVRLQVETERRVMEYFNEIDT